MKKKKLFLFGTILTSSLLVLGACGEPKPSPTPGGDIVDPTPGGDSQDPTPGGDEKPGEPPIENPEQGLFEKYNCITLAEAISKANQAGETETEESFNVYGTVKEITKPQYGEMIISDGTDELYIYGINDYSTMETKPFVGDEVVLSGKLKMFNGSPEMGRATLLEFKHIEQEIDDSDYLVKTIAEARDLAPASKVNLTGVVATITKTQGNVPNGFILVDDTNSIYVHGDTVQQVNVGDKINILGERVNYISDKEAKYASKYGYQGCIQITNSILKKKLESNVTYNNTWIPETTVKKIVETPTSTNITSTMFKVNAYINKQVNPGFTNYYINDLDNKTGSYVYTSNSGSDFKWLDEFDGKLCEVYLTPLNAKSTASGINYRFVPITVKLSDYTFEDKDVPNYVLDYKVKDQFLDQYLANPNLKVLTTYSEERLNIVDAKIAYESSDPTVINFEDDPTDGLTMKALKSGDATITMNVTYKDFKASATKDINVNIIDVSSAINVKQAIDSEDNTEVLVHGIVMSSLVNKTGFYLNDETGVIAVTCSSEDIAKISLGNEVYMKGIRTHKKKDTSSVAGQSVIQDAKLILNKYGEHEYSTASFDTTKKLEDVIDYPTTEDHSTQVYTCKAKVELVETQYYSNINVLSATSPETKLGLYSSGSKQYNWLLEFKDANEITIEFCLCNWNDKSSYKGCIISASDGNKKLINNLNFAK